MSITRENFRSLLNTMLKDDAKYLEVEDKERFITSGKKIYDQDRPREIIKDDDSPDGTEYDFDLPSDWLDGFSVIFPPIEYPIKSSDSWQQPQYVDDNSWIIYKTEDDSKLRFIGFTPASGYIFRYTYTVPHTISETVCTINEFDWEAVCHLAASFCFTSLAAKYSQIEEPTIEADVIDYQRRHDECMALAQGHEMFYRQHMGIGQDKKLTRTGAQATHDLDIGYSYGASYLTHPNRSR